FARGYRLECLAEEDAIIKAGWIRYWSGRNETQIAQILADSEGPIPLRESAKICVSNSYEQIVLAVDPAVSTKSSADRTALVTLGKTPTNEVHVLEAVARRVAAPELVALIDDADRRWRPDAILFESNAAFAGVRDLLLCHA